MKRQWNLHLNLYSIIHENPFQTVKTRNAHWTLTVWLKSYPLRQRDWVLFENIMNGPPLYIFAPDHPGKPVRFATHAGYLKQQGVYLNWANLQSNTQLPVSTYINFLVITKLLDIAWDTWCYVKWSYWHKFHGLICVWLYLNVTELTNLVNSIVEISRIKLGNGDVEGILNIF